MQYFEHLARCNALLQRKTAFGHDAIVACILPIFVFSLKMTAFPFPDSKCHTIFERVGNLSYLPAFVEETLRQILCRKETLHRAC